MPPRRMWRPALWGACLLAAGASSFGQANTAVNTRQRAENLSGDVYYEESAGTRHALKGVIVAECMAGFKNCMMLARTDEEGRFSISSRQNARVHYLQFLSPGWLASTVTVTLAKGAGKLNVRLESGT